MRTPSLLREVKLINWTEEDQGAIESMPVHAAPVVYPPCTPTYKSEIGGQIYGMDPKTAKARYTRLADEGRRYIIGPMPAKRFIAEFVKKDGTLDGMPDPKEAFAKLPDFGGKNGKGKKKAAARTSPKTTPNHDTDKAKGKKKDGEEGGDKSKEEQLYHPFVCSPCFP